MTETIRTSFRMNPLTKEKLATIAEWDGHNNLTSAIETTITRYYVRLRAERLGAGLPVDNPTPQEKTE